jgi:putative ABC transport system substrate-binding protein
MKRRTFIAGLGSAVAWPVAFATFSRQRISAVLVGNSNFYDRRMKQLVALAARHALPVMFPYREHVLAGGLMSYGSKPRL